MKHPKEVQTFPLFPAFLPAKLAGSPWQLSGGNFSEFTGFRTGTEAWQQWVLLGDLSVLAGTPLTVD